ncbi:restriction endonuclease subunit S [Enterococcus sp. MJM12]|uniref:Restriction endonuclease subunit S n=1 Tax=Candidatus Enterococcus myersii TaxID=2815322 RepID=A0ABS3H6J9_9ENTE|nr:restriction endonuclease subunit S [Enterococcus sp. MJM12]MBO0449083.1 restriction endonuclease subunit S [Enterococcus sp. MJM12]
MPENKPAIRFKGFENDWEQRKLEEVAERYDNLRVPITASERVLGDTPYYGANGIQDYIEGFTHEGEFILVAEDGANDLKNYPVQYVKGKVWVNNHAHVLQGYNGITDNKFLMNAIKNINIEPFLVGGGRAKLNADVMMKLSLRLPSFEEQQKIGTFFKQLDDTIALHQQQLENLKKTKKAYLQKMFPKNNEKVPEIRFEGFADDWEQRKLGEVTNLITKGTTPKDKSWAGSVNYVKTESIDSISGYINVTANISLEEHNGYLKRSQLKTDDLLFSIVGTLGRVGVVRDMDLPANTNQQIAVIRLSNIVNNRFIFHSLKTSKISAFIKSDATIGAQPSLSLWQINELNIPYTDITEQVKVGKFLDILDNTIALHQRKLDYLKEMKKGLLQKMFV